MNSNLQINNPETYVLTDNRFNNSMVLNSTDLQNTL